MSSDFDEPKHVPPGSAEPHPERRRSPRWSARVRWKFDGHTTNDVPFHEEAYSSVVNNRGALLVMSTPVAAGERLLLTNKITQTEQECRVVRVGFRNGPSVEVAIEFTGQAPDFWRVAAGPHNVSSPASLESREKAR